MSDKSGCAAGWLEEAMLLVLLEEMKIKKTIVEFCLLNFGIE